MERVSRGQEVELLALSPTDIYKACIKMPISVTQIQVKKKCHGK